MFIHCTTIFSFLAQSPSAVTDTHYIFIENLLWHLREKIRLAKCTQNTIIGVIFKDDSLRNVTFFLTDTSCKIHITHSTIKFRKLLQYYCVFFFSSRHSTFGLHTHPDL